MERPPTEAERVEDISGQIRDENVHAEEELAKDLSLGFQFQRYRPLACVDVQMPSGGLGVR